VTESRKELAAKAVWPLRALNFFMADMQAGVGPFIGVFLLAHGWASGPIGSVMTLGGITGMLITTPAGVMIDATRRKKFYVIVPGICTVVASGIILLSQNFWLVAVSQVATALSDVRHRLLTLGVGRCDLRRYGTAAEHDAAHGLDAPGLRRSISDFLEAPALRRLA